MSDNAITKIAVGAFIVASAGGLTYLYKQHAKNKPPTKWKRIGDIGEIFCYPIKSCSPVKLSEIECGNLGVEKGLLRDRMFMAVTLENQFVTARAQPKLVSVQPRLKGRKLVLSAPGVTDSVHIDFDELEQGQQNQNAIWNLPVETIDCGDDIASWLSHFILGKDVGLRLAYNADYTKNRPMHKWNVIQKIPPKDVGILHDNASYMLVNQASVDELNKHMDEVILPLQFRPNFVIKGPKAFDEDNWTWVRIGDNVIFKWLHPCERCVLTNVNPITGERNSNFQPLKFLKKHPDFMRGGQPVMGTFFGLRQAGRVHIGDAVYVEDRA